MSPRIANKDRGELPKPQVQRGTLGFSPINALTLSYAEQGLSDRVLLIPDESDATLNALGTTRTELHVLPINKTKPEALELQGKLLRGLSDGLYRGKLPEVIICSPAMTQLGSWLNEITEYLEKMLQFGFFLQHDPVDKLFPNMILVSEGVYFKRLMLALSKQLDRNPTLLPQWREKILAKCFRGTLCYEQNSEQPNQSVSNYYPFSEPVALFTPPKKIRIASNHPLLPYRTSPNFNVVDSILAIQGFQVILENSVPNAVERLELEYALNRSSAVVQASDKPVAKNSASKNNKKEEPYQAQIWNAIVRLGQQLQAFDQQENLQSVKANIEPIAKENAKESKTASNAKSGAKTQKNSANTESIRSNISVTDISLFDSLRHYAQQLSLTEEEALFASINQTLKAEWQNQEK